MEGSAGESVTITLESDSFDCYLYVAGPGLGDVLTDDDSAGDLDSQITVSFPEDGTYTIVASSLSGGSTGPYTIRVEEPTDMRELPTEGRTLSVGDVARGILTSSDAVIVDGRHGQAWALEGVEGETYTIDLMSEDLDPYLYIVGPGMPGPRTNDDGGEGFNARITVTLPEDGTYRVIASSLSASRMGPYTLRVTRLER